MYKHDKDVAMSVLHVQHR